MINHKNWINTVGIFCAVLLSLQIDVLGQDEPNGLHEKEKPVVVDRNWARSLARRFGDLLNATFDQIANQKPGEKESAGEIYYETVATISTLSRQVGAVSRLLAKNDIDCMIAGSRSLGIAVHPRDAKRARAVLRAWKDEHSANLNILPPKDDGD